MNDKELFDALDLYCKKKGYTYVKVAKILQVTKNASSTVCAINHSSFTHEISGSWKIFNLKYSISRKP